MTLKVSVQNLFTWVLKFNIIWAIFLPLILAIILSIFPIQGLFFFKDIVFYSSFLMLLLIGRSKGLISYTFMLLCFILYLLLLTSVFFELNPWIIYNLRQLIVPLLIFGFGYYINITDNEKILGVVWFLYKISFWLVIIGLVFKYFEIWNYISLEEYFTLKGIPVDKRGVSYMFYEPAVFYTERMVSTVLDPISLGHIIAAPLILCFYSIGIDGKKRKRLLLILFTGLILTFSKGAILQIILALFFFNKGLPIILRVLVPTLFIIMSLVLINLDGILIHLIGIKNAIISINLFGYGVGLVGNYAKMFADDLSVYYQLKISDTFIGSVIGQIGFFGFLFWISFFLFKLKSFFIDNKFFVGSIILLSQLIIAIISENSFNFTSFIIPGIMAGLLIKNKI